MRGEDPWLKADRGRTLLLGGVHLRGSSRLASISVGVAHIQQDLRQQRAVAFPVSASRFHWPKPTSTAGA